MLKLYVAKYEDHMYPEDNCILGQYWSEEDAQKHIDYNIESERNTNPRFPGKHTAMSQYYSIEELEFEVPPELADLIRNLYKIAKHVKIGDIIGDDDALNITGLSPWCINEGRANKTDKVDLYKLKDVMNEYGIDLYP